MKTVSSHKIILSGTVSITSYGFRSIVVERFSRVNILGPEGTLCRQWA